VVREKKMPLPEAEGYLTVAAAKPSVWGRVSRIGPKVDIDPTVIMDQGYNLAIRITSSSNLLVHKEKIILKESEKLNEDK
jgi:hypothetical protein